MAVSWFVLRKTALTGFLTVVSRVFGLARDIVLAVSFGVGLDVFLVAFRLPNLLRRLFAEGAMAQAVTPILSEYRTRRGLEAERALLSHIGARLLAATTVAMVLGIALAPVLIYLVAPGFAGDSRGREAADMLPICFLYLPLISLTILVGAALNVHGHFTVPAFIPAVMNLSLIACALFLAPLLPVPIYALAIAVPLAGVLQLAVSLPCLKRYGLLVRPAWNADREGGSRAFRLMLPTIFAVSVTQINLMVDTFIASFLPEGSVSWLYYADRMMEFPLGVFGVALATVLLPSLAACHADDRSEESSRLLDVALRWCLLIGMPAAAGLFVLDRPIMMSLFTYGEFSPDDAGQAAMALRAYTVGVPALILVKVLAVGHFARLDVISPARIAMICVGANLLFNLIFVWSLAHAGLALATSLAAWVQAGLLFITVKRHGYSPVSGWPSLLLRLLIGCALMVGFICLLMPMESVWLDSGAAGRVMWLSLLVVGGGCIYVASLAALGLRPRHFLTIDDRPILGAFRRHGPDDE